MKITTAEIKKLHVSAKNYFSVNEGTIEKLMFFIKLDLLSLHFFIGFCIVDNVKGMSKRCQTINDIH